MSLTIPTAEELLALPPEYLMDDNGEALLNISIAFIVIVTLTYILFIISRAFCAERNGWEIWVLPFLAYIFCMGVCAVSITLVKIGGAGRHIAYWFIADLTIIPTFLKLQTAAEFIYVISVTFPKLSILVLYLKIFTGRKSRIVTWVVIGVVVANAVAQVIACFTICRPFAFKWDKTINGRCDDLMASYRYVSIPNILTDIIILVLPSGTLWKLQIKNTRKFGIFLTFLMGGLGIVAAIIRFVGFYTNDLLADPTWHATALMIYTVIEPGAYFMCSCFPGLRPLLRYVYRKSGLSTKIDSYYNSSTYASDHQNSDNICLRNLNGSNVTSISATKARMTRDDDSRFIRLEESVDVDVSRGYMKRG